MAEPICPANCGTALPVVSFNDCTPEINLSEIEYLLVAKPGAADLDDPTDPAEWADRIDNSSVSLDAIRQFRVTGDLPIPTDNEVTISGQRKIVVGRDWVINFDVDETNDTNHEAFRQMQCGGSYKFWFVTRSGHVFGGTTGITGTIKVNLVLGRGENEIQKWTGVANWKSKFTPERALWAVYGGANVTPTFTFHYGFKAAEADANPDSTAIAAAASGTADESSDVTVPNFGNTADKVVWYAEPLTEPVKTKWYNSVINNGPIGASETFLAPVTVGTWRLYVSGFETTFDTPPAVTFKKV